MSFIWFYHKWYQVWIQDPLTIAFPMAATAEHKKSPTPRPPDGKDPHGHTASWTVPGGGGHLQSANWLVTGCSPVMWPWKSWEKSDFTKNLKIWKILFFIKMWKMYNINQNPFGSNKPFPKRCSGTSVWLDLITSSKVARNQRCEQKAWAAEVKAALNSKSCRFSNGKDHGLFPENWNSSWNDCTVNAWNQVAFLPVRDHAVQNCWLISKDIEKQNTHSLVKPSKQVALHLKKRKNGDHGCKTLDLPTVFFSKSKMRMELHIASVRITEMQAGVSASSFLGACCMVDFKGQVFASRIFSSVSATACNCWRTAVSSGRLRNPRPWTKKCTRQVCDRKMQKPSGAWGSNRKLRTIHLRSNLTADRGNHWSFGLGFCDVFPIPLCSSSVLNT